MRIVAAAALVVALAGASALGAQQNRFLVGAQIGVFEPSGFADTYDAVYGDTLTPIGLRFEIDWGRWFGALTVERMKADGERVALVPEPVPTGIPISLTLTPVRLSAARRFRDGAAWRPYVGGGVTVLSWKEEDEFESTSSTDFGAHLLGGLAWHGARMRAGGELVWSTVPNALEGGVSQELGEDDLGGLSASLYVGWSF